ncbi:MAG: hypothetical protein WA981_12210, partial [Glaciecola sp.]
METRKQNNLSLIEQNEEIIKIIIYLIRIKMRYHEGPNNTATGKIRLDLTMLILTRFKVTTPSILAWFYNINKRQAQEHIRKLLKRKYIVQTITHRSLDNVAYSPSFLGANYVQQTL